MNIQNLIDKIEKVVESHKISEGVYARWIWQNSENTRKLGINEYGCADAANILYTIGKFEKDPEKRKKWVDALCSLQDEKTGLFSEETHHFIHTTAHCTAALELFDARPLYPFYALEKYKTKEGLYELLDGLNWENNPWPQSHQGAGIYAAFSITDSVGPEWKKWYFDWFWENASEEIGFWKKGVKRNAPIFAYMAGGFHYMFNHEDAKMPYRYPEKIIDTCLDMYYNNLLRADFGRYVGFLEIDWVYSLTRASRQTAHRFDDVKKAIRDFAFPYLEWLDSLDYKTDELFNDLHMLFGAVCCLAELQSALPGEIETDKPLKIVLNRRPFI